MSKGQKATFLYTDTTGRHLRVYKIAMFSLCPWGMSLHFYIVWAVSALDGLSQDIFIVNLFDGVFFSFM